MSNKEIMPLPDKLELIKGLIEDIGGIYDYDNTEYRLSEIYYDQETDKVYAKWEVAQ